MGCIQTTFKHSKAIVADTEISRTLRRIEKNRRNKSKILLLGAGDSGKTTIFKQMRYLYGKGHSTEALRGMRKAIFHMLVEGTNLLISRAGSMEGTTPITDEESLKAAALIQETPSDAMRLNADTAKAIWTLWNDSDIQSVWQQRSKLDIIEAFGHFAEKCKDFPEWGGDKWMPNREDYLLGRIRTTGITEETFVVGDATLQITDVGGQRNERRKWIHCFEGVTAVLFIAASSEYDQVLFENKRKNRLAEALDLFETMTNSDWFRHTTMILFLNKADLFKEKYVKRHIPLNISGNFPNAPKTFKFRDGMSWMKQEFLKRNEVPDKMIFVHVTTALDDQNIKVVIEAVKNTILEQSLKDMNLFKPRDNY